MKLNDRKKEQFKILLKAFDKIHVIIENAKRDMEKINKKHGFIPKDYRD